MKVHFVYAGRYYCLFNNVIGFQSLMFELMKKYKFKSVTVTVTNMLRDHLITKEKRDDYCLGKDAQFKLSVNDDLELLLEKMRLGDESETKNNTYFLPKLTTKEMKLVERKDIGYLKTFWHTVPDVPKAEMLLSESNSKFVYSRCWRETFTIENLADETVDDYKQKLFDLL